MIFLQTHADRLGSHCVNKGGSTNFMTIVFDKKTMRPGCVLLQVAMGGTVPRHLFNKHFNSEHWLVHLTPDLKPYTVTEEELPRISQLVEQRHGRIK